MLSLFLEMKGGYKYSGLDDWHGRACGIESLIANAAIIHQVLISHRQGDPGEQDRVISPCALA